MSVVADLREASLAVTRRIAEILLLLQVRKEVMTKEIRRKEMWKKNRLGVNCLKQAVRGQEKKRGK